MFSPRNSLASLLMIVIFLVLIAIAASSYGGNQDQKTEMERNFFWQKTFSVIDMAKAAVQGLVDFGLGQKKDETVNDLVKVVNYDNAAAVAAVAIPAVTGSDKDGGFWSGMISQIKEEWQKGNDEIAPESNQTTAGEKFLDWQKTATGADLIFREKNGAEHKLPLPFKFLSE